MLRSIIFFLGLLGMFIAAAAQAAMPPVRIGIKAAGLYAITYSDLTGLGINLSTVDPRRLTLRHGDQPVAIRVEGEQDGAFDPSDRIVFYAQGIGWDDPVFAETDVDVYWLEEGTSAGLRMATSDGTVAGSYPNGRWAAIDHVEIDRIYDAGIGYPDTSPRLFMDDVEALNQATRAFTLTHHLDASQSAHVTVRLQGKTDDPSVNPDHRTQILINGCTLGAGQTWDGMTYFTQQETIPSGCLVEGQNQLTVKSLDTGALVDSLYVDNFDIQYVQTEVAIADALDVAGAVPATLTGFTTPDIDVYAVGDGFAPRWISGATVTSVSGSYQATFGDAGATGVESYRVLGRTRYAAPYSLAMQSPNPPLKDKGYEIDYIIITHPAFIPALQSLAQHRAARGLRVKIVDVTQIYDEFSGGVTRAQALYDFLSYAYFNWKVRPSYVLLAGGASVTFKVEPLGIEPTYVPAHFYHAFDGTSVPSDNWFVAVDGNDPLPDMFVGRLPVTPASVAGTIQKIIAYDSPANTDTDWMRQSLFIADDDPVFWSASDDMSAALRPAYVTNRLYLGLDITSGDPRNPIRNFMANGVAVTTYTGHGAAQQWTLQGYVTSDDVATFSNANRLTFLVALNCLNGYFVLPTQARNKLSMASAFVTSNEGGAIAAWASSYLGFTPDHRVMGVQLFSAIRSQDDRGLGAVTTEARIQALANGAQDDTVDSYIYFGDPSTVLVSRAALAGGGSGGGGSGAIDAPLVLTMAIWVARSRRRATSRNDDNRPRQSKSKWRPSEGRMGECRRSRRPLTDVNVGR